jgi:murein L,D-transpeptidase YafK
VNINYKQMLLAKYGERKMRHREPLKELVTSKFKFNAKYQSKNTSRRI